MANTRFGLTNGDDFPGMETLLGLTAQGRQFSGSRQNAPYSTGIPSSFDQSIYNPPRRGYPYRNEEHAHKDAQGNLTPPTGLDFGGVNTQLLWWSVMGDALDIHTPTTPTIAGMIEHDAWWHARKIDIAAMVQAQGGPPYRPYLLAWHHEQKVNPGIQIGVGPPTITGLAANGLGTAAEYAAGFRHVAAILNDDYGPGQPGWPAGVLSGRLRDIGMLKMCMVPVLAQFMSDTTTFASLYASLDNQNNQGSVDKPDPYGSRMSIIDPGAAYVDLYGIDWYPLVNNTQPPNGLFSPSIHDQLIYFDAVSKWSKDHGKQWMIGEWGPKDRTDIASFQRWGQINAAAAPRFETYGTGPGSLYEWNTSADAITTTAPNDDGSGVPQIFQANVVNRPYYYFIGDTFTPAFGTAEYIEAIPQNLASSASVTFGGPIVAGDLLVLIGAASVAPANFVTPAGYTAGPVSTNTTVGYSVKLFYKVATGSESLTQTLTLSVAERFLLAGYRVVGAATSNPLDVQASANSGVSTVTSQATGTTGALANPQSFAIAAGGSNSGAVAQTAFAWSSYSLSGSQITPAATVITSLSSASLLTSSTAAQSSTLSWTGAGNAAALVAVFKPKAGAQQLAVPLLDQTPQLFSPGVTQAIAPTTVSIGNLVQQTPVLFAPTLNFPVVPPLLNQTPTLFSPTVNTAAAALVGPPLLNQSPVLFPPAVNPSLSLLTSNSSTTGSSFVTASVTPTAGSWVVIDVVCGKSGGIGSPTVTDSLSSTVVTAADVQSSLLTFRAGRYFIRATAATARTITVTYPVAYTAAVWHVYEIDHASTVAPFVQTLTANPAGSGTAVAGAALAPFANSGNRTLITAVHQANGVSDPPAGYTEIADTHIATGPVGMATAWRPDVEDDVPSYSWATSSAGRTAIYSEINLFLGTPQSVTVPLLDQSPQLFTPRVTIVFKPPLLNQSPVLFAPFVTDQVAVPLLDQTPRLFAPKLTFQMRAPLLNQSPVLFAPTVPVPSVRPPLLNQTPTLFPPSTSQAPPPTPPIDPITGTDYTVDVKTRAGAAVVSDIPIASLTYSKALNAPGAATFSLPIRHPSVTQANIMPMQHQVIISRGGTPVWGGDITSAHADLDRQEVSFTCEGFFGRLTRRLITDDLYYKDVEQVNIAANLLTYTNNVESTGITIGSHPATGITRARHWCCWQGNDVASAILDLAASDDGFDFQIDPSKVFTTYFPMKGAAVNKVFDAGLNIFGMTLSIDGSDIVNQVMDIPDSEICTDITVVSDATSDTTYGLLQEALNLTHVKNQQDRVHELREELRIRKRPHTTVELMNVPDGPFGSVIYDVGDNVKLTAAVGYATYTNVTFRVMSYTTTVKDGAELTHLSLDKHHHLA